MIRPHYTYNEGPHFSLMHAAWVLECLQSDPICSQITTLMLCGDTWNHKWGNCGHLCPRIKMLANGKESHEHKKTVWRQYCGNACFTVSWLIKRLDVKKHSTHEGCPSAPAVRSQSGEWNICHIAASGWDICSWERILIRNILSIHHQYFYLAPEAYISNAAITG